MIFFSMLLLGALLGFVGAGGAGMTISLLVAGFDVPMHTALAVAITAMIFTMLSGTISHLREGEVETRLGLIMGAGGAMGAFAGAAVANVLPTRSLKLLTASMMFASCAIMYVRLYHGRWLEKKLHTPKTTRMSLLPRALSIGFLMGFLSGAFGIGATAFIQLSLLIVFGMPLLKSIGTCMLVILPISLSGSLGYILHGRLDMGIFIETLGGLVTGSFIGANFTHLAPMPLLKAVIVVTPFVGGLILLTAR